MPDHQWIIALMSETNTTSSWDGAGTGTEWPPGGGSGVPEPIPDWSVARRAWSWGWYVHIYGLGTVYLLLALYAGLSMLEFRRRLRIQQYILAINWILLLLGASRALFLFIDAYESTGKLPTPVSRVLYGIAFPCLTSSYSLIQLVFMRITRVNMGSRKLQNYRVLAAIITSHFTIVIVIDITVAYRNNLKWLLMLCQSFFIAWGLILCFGFVYGGFKMTQFTTETQRVLKQLATYQRVKQETGGAAHRKHELALHRIARPKLRILEDENGALSGMSDSSGEESSNSLSFYNEAPLIFDDTTLANAYINNQCDRLNPCSSSKRLKGEKSTMNAGKAEARKTKYRNLTSIEDGESDSLPYLSSESDYVTDPSAVVRAEIQLSQCLTRTRLNATGDEPPGESGERFFSTRLQCAAPESRPTTEDVVTPLMTQQNHASVTSTASVSHRTNNISNGLNIANTGQDPGCKVGSDVLPNKCHHCCAVDDELRSSVGDSKSRTSHCSLATAAFVNPTLDLNDDLNQPFQDCVIMNGFVHGNHGFEGLSNHTSHRSKPIDITSQTLDDVVQESGYMADTELNSPKQKKRFWKHNGSSRHRNQVHNPNNDPDPDEGDGDGPHGSPGTSPRHEPYPLRQLEGGATVSLYRIRQGRTLHKALKVSYLSTLLGFICCILQLYAMFGVYGVLSTDRHVEPWPWYVYHLFLRLGELGMAGSMAVTASYFSHHRNRCKRVRKRRQLEQQTQC